MSSNMSAGQWIGAIVGAVAGFFTGGATWYATAASMATGASAGMAVGGMIDPPKGPNIFGPRLSDLSQQAASYGVVIPRIYGAAPVMGNVFWIENNGLKETSATESAGGKGGGGSEVTTFSYSATFALGLCKGPIAGIRRIWITGKLFYDAGSDDVETISASNQSASAFRLYLGSDDQEPDARMQATLGVDNTPAFRGLAYIVFDDMALKNYGNTLTAAQIKVEIVATAAARPFVKFHTNMSTGRHFHDDIGGSGKAYPLSVENGFIKVAVIGGTHTHTFDANGKLVLTEEAATAFGTVVGPGTFCGQLGGLNVVFSGDIYTQAPIDPVSPRLYCEGVSKYGGYEKINLETNLPTGKYISAVACDINQQSVMVLINPDPGWSSALSAVGEYYELDVNGAVLRSGVTSFNTSIGQNHGFGFSRYAPDISFPSGSYDKSQGVLFANPGSGYAFPINRYDINDGVMSVTSTGLRISHERYSAFPSVFTVAGDLHVFAGPTYDYFRTAGIQPGFPSLGEIITAEVEKSGILTSSDIDVASLTDSVRGYRIAAVSAIRSNIDTLQAAWPFDVVQSGYKITFKRRGGVGVATVTAEMLGASASEKMEYKFTQAREMDTQIPYRVTVNYMDVLREYDNGSQYAERLNTDSINVRNIELPLVMTSNEAIQKAEILLFMYWLERYDVAFKLPPQYRYLEPADVVSVGTDNGTFLLRLTSINYASNGVIEIEAKYHDDSVYTSTAIADSGVLSSGIIRISGPSRTTLLDIPLLLDSTDSAGFVVAMGGITEKWAGGSLVKSADGGQTWALTNTFSVPAVTGRAINSISSPADHRMIDKSSSLSVSLYGGQSVSSVTELQMLNGANHFAYGIDGRWEIIAAQNCDLQLDGTYIFTDLLRGRFGSEWTMASHAASDIIVLLDPARVQFSTSSANLIGAQLEYRGISAGQNIASVGSTSFTYKGVNLECLAPIYLNGNRHPATNDWSLTWLRRTRVGGEWRDFVDAALGETSESYALEIYDGPGYASVVRTINATTATAAYSSIDQVADFGSNQSTIYVRIYQVSAIVGRGYPLTQSITR